ncbi:MAG: aminoglycoside phosphotransferase family protein [Chloroflexota bacterium]
MIPEVLNHYLQTWSLLEPTLLAETRSSLVYTVAYQGESAVLKLLKPAGEEEQEGAIALAHFNGHGAVRLLRHDSNAHLLEYADGEDLVGMVKRGDDAQAAMIIADVLNQLHAVPLNSPTPLTPLRTWYRALFTQADIEREKGSESIYVRAAALAEKLLDNPEQQVVLHGDIHHANIRYRAGRGWLAFDPKGLYGERTYDAANTLCNPIDMRDLVENEARLLPIAGILAERLNLDLTRLLAFVYVYVCLSACWWLGDGVDPVGDMRIAAIVEPHLAPFGVG